MRRKAYFIKTIVPVYEEFYIHLWWCIEIITKEIDHVLLLMLDYFY